MGRIIRFHIVTTAPIGGSGRLIFFTLLSSLIFIRDSGGPAPPCRKPRARSAQLGRGGPGGTPSRCPALQLGDPERLLTARCCRPAPSRLLGQHAVPKLTGGRCWPGAPGGLLPSGPKCAALAYRVCWPQAGQEQGGQGLLGFVWWSCTRWAPREGAVSYLPGPGGAGLQRVDSAPRPQPREQVAGPGRVGSKRTACVTAPSCGASPVCRGGQAGAWAGSGC